MMADMDKAALLGKTKRRVRKVETPDGDVYIRSLTLKEINELEAEGFTMTREGKAVPNLDGSDARFLVRVLSDAAGNRLFNDLDAASVTHLDAGYMEPILEAARQHVKGLEGVRGNVPPASTPNGASS